MTAIWRHKSTWSGPAGLPGYTSLYFESGAAAQDVANQAQSFLADILKAATGADMLPTGVTITPDAFVDTIDDTDGTLATSVGVTAPSPIVGSGSGAYSAAAGACISWNTNGIRRGRRVRGRTFLVPLGSTALENNGTLSSSFTGQVPAAISAYLGGLAHPVVWCRPSSPGASDGVSFRIIGGSVKDKTAVLRSRRD